MDSREVHLWPHVHIRSLSEAGSVLPDLNQVQEAFILLTLIGAGTQQNKTHPRKQEH